MGADEEPPAAEPFHVAVRDGVQPGPFEPLHFDPVVDDVAERIDRRSVGERPFGFGDRPHDPETESRFVVDFDPHACVCFYVIIRSHSSGMSADAVSRTVRPLPSFFLAAGRNGRRSHAAARSAGSVRFRRRSSLSCPPHCVSLRHPLRLAVPSPFRRLFPSSLSDPSRGCSFPLFSAADGAVARPGRNVSRRVLGLTTEPPAGPERRAVCRGGRGCGAYRAGAPHVLR